MMKKLFSSFFLFLFKHLKSSTPMSSAQWDQMHIYIHGARLRETHGTSRGREFYLVDFTEADRVDGGRRAVVAEPVWSIHCLRTIDPNHEVPVCQHLPTTTAAEVSPVQAPPPFPHTCSIS